MSGPTLMSLRRARELREAISLGPARDVVAVVPWQGEEVVYRLVRNDPPKSKDFQSWYELGKPRVRPADPFVLYLGISTFSSLELVLLRAVPPTLVARVRLREGMGFNVAKTYGEGHFTVWGGSGELAELAEVVEEIPA